MIGLVGAGLLGGAIAERLLAAGMPVRGYDRDAARCESLRSMGADVAESPAAVAAACTRIVFSLPTTEVVESVIAGMASALRPGHLVIDTTTGEPARTAALGASLAVRGIDYLDATVSGSSEEARAGRAVVVAGGTPEAFAAAEDVFRAFARRWFHVGPCGSGSAMKLVSNLVLGLNRAALAEGLSLGRALGVDLTLALEVLREGASYSRAMDAKGRKMIEGDFQPQARLAQHFKDVRLMLAAAERAGRPLPLSALHAQLLEALVAAGHGDLDNSAIIKAFESGPPAPSPRARQNSP
jgi:3-hydroxyisobutyrate dehydrogenase-like beta-hydroxyacid dehydrogenase